MTEFEIRREEVDGVSDWMWIKHDSGLWDGPKNDWKNSHKHKILKLCKNFRVVVQAGGGCGMYPRLLSNIFDVVYTFEPVEDNFLCLSKNCYGRKIIKFNCAVGSTPSLVSIRGGNLINETNCGTARVEEKNHSYIPQMMIDQIQYPGCDLLMLDVEGYESQALIGAMETIQKFNPVIFVELGTKVQDWMEKLGYKVMGPSAMDTIYVREKT